MRAAFCRGASICARAVGKAVRGSSNVGNRETGRMSMRPYGFVTSALIFIAATLTTGSTVVAQETNHPCLTVATPEPSPSPSPVASPVGATPVASPEGATPIGAVEPAVDPGDAAAIVAVQQAIAACASEGDYSGMSTLVTTRYLNEIYSAGQTLTRRDFIDEIAPLLPINPVRVVSVEQVQPAGNGATALVMLVVGNQLVQFESSFVQQGAGENRRWLLDSAVATPVARPEGADIVHVRIDDGSYRLGEDVARSPDVVLKGTNEGEATHEMLVVRLEGGASTDALLVSPGPHFPQGITFVGQVTIAPGATDELVLVDLTPGQYAIVCLLFDEEGNPYLASGMRASLEVT